MQCQADKAAVEERMKQLRNMINSDFDNMVDFGKKVFVHFLGFSEVDTLSYKRCSIQPIESDRWL